MLFSRDNNESEKPKKRSTFGLLFNPDFGSDIRPIGESIVMFVRLVAMIFASNGLFPKNHPALLGDVKARLTMGEVIATAYSNVSFTREGLPKAAMFCAVVGTLVFSAVFIVVVLLSLFMGTAHAEGMFTPPDPKCDLAGNWLDYLFLKKNVTNPDCKLLEGAVIVPATGAVQNAIVTALSYYSGGILVVAGMILLYHLMSMVAETAHSGVPMGKNANQIWAPIRLVVAIGLLVPVGSNGLNTAQYIIVQMAKWGSGLASNVWNGLLTNINDSSKEGYGELSLEIPPPPSVVSVVNDIILIKACVIGYNNIVMRSLPAPYTDYLITISPPAKLVPCAAARVFGEKDTSQEPYCVSYAFQNDPKKDGGVTCGEIVLTPEPDSNAVYPNGKKDYAVSPFIQGIVKELYTAHVGAVKTLLSTSSNVNKAAKGINNYLDAAYVGSDDVYTPEQALTFRKAAIDEYRTKLYNELSKAKKKLTEQKFDLSKSQGLGWVTAGAWFNTIARAQGVIFSGAESPIPKTTVPIKNMGRDSTWVDGLESFVRHGVQYTSLKSAPEKLTESITKFSEEILQAPLYSSAERAAEAGTVKGLPQGGMLMTAALDAVNAFGVGYGVWPSGDGLLYKFGKSANPFAELAYYGYATLEMGLTILANAGAAGVVSGAVSFLTFGLLQPLKNLAGAALAFFFMVGALFVSAGLSLCYLLPLIPFIKFFFNVLTWILSVFGAVVSAPLFALAHLTPHGEGLPGGMARTGYFFILGLFLRPVLTVIGLIAGLMMFFIAINFLNLTFSIAAAGSGSAGGALAVLSKIVFTVLYVALAYICANKSFGAISFFPESALKWLGAQDVPTKDMGDNSHVTGVLSMVGAYASKELAGQLQSMGKSVGDMGSAHRARVDTLAEKDQAAQVGAQRHKELINNQLLAGGRQYERDASGNLTGRVISAAGAAAFQGGAGAGAAPVFESPDPASVSQASLPSGRTTTARQQIIDEAYAFAAPQLQQLKGRGVGGMASSGDSTTDANEQSLRKYHQNRVIESALNRLSGQVQMYGLDQSDIRERFLNVLRRDGHLSW